MQANDSAQKPTKQHAKYLSERGVSEAMMAKLQLEFCDAEALQKFKFPYGDKAASGMVWHVRNIHGEVNGAVGARLFYGKTFGEDKRPKFVQPANQNAGLYFSPLYNWDRLRKRQRIYICESWLKADVLCGLGLAAVGVAGIWGWSKDYSLIPEFDQFPWERLDLTPVVIFDSNVNTTTQGGTDNHQAVLAFSTQMFALYGVWTRWIPLPAGPDGDWGIDDYFAAHGAKKTKSLVTGDGDRVPSDDLKQYLKAFNGRLTVVNELARIVDMRTNVFMSKANFTGLNFANHILFEGEKNKPIKVAPRWVEWRGRNTVDTALYLPGGPPLVKDESPSFYNTWRGMGVRPVEGDVSLFTEWLADAFPHDDERRYVEQWLAAPLQDLGLKMMQSLVVVGISGVGKGWLAAILKGIYGMDNVAPLLFQNLDSRFNGDYGEKQMVIVEEGSDTKKLAGGTVYTKLKDLITNPHLRVERKSVDAYLVPNKLNMYISANSKELFNLDEFDRRFAIFDIDNERIANKASYWDPRFRWLEAGGLEAIYWHLQRVDLTGFDPHGDAPHSRAKHELIEINRSPIDNWAHRLKESPDEVLRLNGGAVTGSLMTAKELYWIHREGSANFVDVTPQQSAQMSRALSQARVPMLLDAQDQEQKVKLPNGSSSRVYAVRAVAALGQNLAQHMKEREGLEVCYGLTPLKGS